MQSGVLVLMCIAYLQPVAREELQSFFGKEVSCDLIGRPRGAGLIASLLAGDIPVGLTAGEDDEDDRGAAALVNSDRRKAQDDFRRG
jgi:hypothetical protein